MIEPARVLPPRAPRFQQGALIVGAAALVLTLIGAFLARENFFRAYLAAFVFWLGISLGCLVIMSLHHLTGGRWSGTVLRFLEAGSWTVPLMAVLFIPLLFGLQVLYVWARPEVVATDAVLQAKSPYLNVPFFVIRAIAYFAIWTALAFFMRKWTLEREGTADPRLTGKLSGLGAAALVIYGVTTTFAAIDWIMSMEPHWYSSMYGLMVSMSFMLAGMAFVIVVLCLLANWSPFARVLNPQVLNDLGSLLLAFVILWAYLSFSQFMLQWAGNLTEEIPWYLRRLQGGWQFVVFGVVLLHFTLPFLLLMFRDVKRSVTTLLPVALLILVTRYLDVVWLVGPATPSVPVTPNWIYLVAPVGIGGLWLAMFLRNLAGRPLVEQNDPRFRPEESDSPGPVGSTS